MPQIPVRRLLEDSIVVTVTELAPE